ncbi:MAG: hypothetical protein ACWGMZ_03080, partial [Thermoguttaceae bacterium]
LENDGIKITDGAVKGIIREYTYEAGVRNLEREIGRICRKLTRRLAENKSPSSRLHQVASLLKKSDLIDQLRKTHDVSIFQFNDELKINNTVTLPKRSGSDKPSPPAPLPKGEGSWTDAKSGVDVDDLLRPVGSETRLGQALRDLLAQQRDFPLSGIILFSDGGQNAGISPEAAIELARETKTPIFAVGLGSAAQSKNVLISDLIVPGRAYPGDRYTVTGYIQSRGLAGKVVQVQVLSRPAGKSVSAEGTGKALDAKQVTLGKDGEITAVKFELLPEDTGRRTICLRVLAPDEDRNQRDNFREAEVEIVDRKNHVLLFAGGAMRDYQFLRTLLFRDHSTRLDVLLQSGAKGISQEGNILDKFPSTRRAMYDYDCVAAFDPDWQALDPLQVGLLESWVAEQGGGLIVVAGAVNTGKAINNWTQHQAMTPIRNLYPVEFPRRLFTGRTEMNSAAEPYPLELTREGLESDFLRLGDSAASGADVWSAFPGVYSYCPVQKPKQGASVYMRIHESQSYENEDMPVYMAGQFYGSGRVFYLGSGEIWRLRAMDESYFAQFYTKLIRHVSQGRLLRGSSRGVLLTGQDRYQLGNSVEIHAQLLNSRLEPPVSSGVQMQVFTPGGAMQNLMLRPDKVRPGSYQGRFPATEEGDYRLELPVPESDNERLVRRIQVKAPELEREHPLRNDALLSQIARQTGGKYYIATQDVLHERPSLVEQLKDRSCTMIQIDPVDPRVEEKWLGWLMFIICGLLCVEWLTRRLVKLA